MDQVNRFKKRSANFRDDETKLLIQLWGSPHIQNKLYLTHRKEPVMRLLAANMQKRGFYRRPDEIKTRIRNLKCLYHRIKRTLRTGAGFGTIDPDWPHYRAMDEILTRRSVVNKIDLYKADIFSSSTSATASSSSLSMAKKSEASEERRQISPISAITKCEVQIKQEVFDDDEIEDDGGDREQIVMDEEMIDDYNDCEDIKSPLEPQPPPGDLCAKLLLNVNNDHLDNSSEYEEDVPLPQLIPAPVPPPQPRLIKPVLPNFHHPLQRHHHHQHQPQQPNSNTTTTTNNNNNNLKPNFPTIPFPLLILNGVQNQNNPNQSNLIATNYTKPFINNNNNNQQSSDNASNNGSVQMMGGGGGCGVGGGDGSEMAQLLQQLLDVQKQHLHVERERLELEKQRLDFERVMGAQVMTSIMGGGFLKEKRQQSPTENVKNTKILRQVINAAISRYVKEVEVEDSENEGDSGVQNDENSRESGGNN